MEFYNCVFLNILFGCLLWNTSADTIPNFIKPCTGRDCLKKAIQAAVPGFIDGVPDLGIGSLDPFVIDKLDLVLPGGLTMAIRQGYTKGLRKCVIDSARLNKSNLEIQFRCNLIIKGEYKSSGRLLIFTIDGDGAATIKCKNIVVSAVLKLGTHTRDGKKYLEIRDFDTKYKYDGQVQYRMTNLFKGNPEMSNLVLDFINRNWQLVADEFGKPLVDYGIRNIIDNLNKLFNVVPLENVIGTTDLNLE